jgi:copper resistance protein B
VRRTRRFAAFIIGILAVCAAGQARAQTGHEHQHPAPDPHAEHRTPEADTSSPMLPPFIPPVTDADRERAFPDVGSHEMGDRAMRSFLLFDQLEWQSSSGPGWDVKGWVGHDRSRLWYRSEGEAADGRLDEAEVQVFYGRAVRPWWDVVVGVRQDFGPDPTRTWAAVGVQGLTPQWFDVEATAYVGSSGRSQFRVEVEYEALVTRRIALQPLIEADVYGKDDPELGHGAGLGRVDAGVRLRWEIRRDVAPYVGVVWRRTFFGTAEAAARAGDSTRGPRLVVGLRWWR